MIKRLSIIILLLLLFPSAAVAATYYADWNNGTDQVGCGAASGASACKTPSRVFTEQSPGNGDTVSIAASASYVDNTQCTLPIGVNFVGAGGVNGSTKITSSTQYYLVAQTSVPAQAGNQTISGVWLAEAAGARHGLILSGRTDVIIDDVKITGAYDWGLARITGKFGYDDSSGDFWRNDCTGSEPTCSHCDNDYSLSVMPLSTDYAQNIEIKNCQFGDTTDGGQVRFAALGSGCKIHDNIWYDSTAGHFVSGECYWWNAVEFYNNTLTHGGGTINVNAIALEVWHLYNGTKIYNNTSNGWFSLGGNSQGGEDQDPISYELYDNTFNSSLSVDAGRECIEIMGYMQNVYVYGNYIIGTYQRGIGLWGQGTIGSITIRNNVFYNTGEPIAIIGNLVNSDIDNVYIYHNIFDCGSINTIGIASSLGDVDGVIIKNNIFLSPNYSAIIYPSGHTVSGCYFTYNDAYNATSGATQDLGSGGWTDNSTGNQTYNPELNNSGNRPDPYYRASSFSSNVVNAGVDVGLSYYGSAPDIGRYEYDEGPSAALTGTLGDGATEVQIVAGNQILIITLSEDTWVATVGEEGGGAQQIGQMDCENNLIDSIYDFLFTGYECPSYVSGHTNEAARSAHNDDDCEAAQHSLVIGIGGGVEGPHTYSWASEELYIKWWAKYEAAYINSSDNVKIFWNGSGAHNEIILDSGMATLRWQLSGSGSGWSSGITKYSSNFGDIKGTWTKFEIYIKQSTGAGHLNADGMQWIKVNGDYVIYEDDVKTGEPDAMVSPGINGTADQATDHGWWQIDDYEVWDGIPGVTNNLITGIDSGASEPAGWDVEVKANMVYTDVVRTNDTVVTITLGAESSYAITTNETITVTIPATALVESDSAVVATPTFEITATSDPSVALTGTLADNATEAQIVAGGETLIVTLTNDTWVAAGAPFDAVRQDLIDSMNSAQSEATGWNFEVRDKEVVTAVVREVDDITVTITLSAAAAYDISANETITMTVDDSALVTSETPVAGTPTYNIIFFDTSTEEIVGMTLQ